MVRQKNSETILLNQCELVDVRGFEPLTPCLQSRIYHPTPC